MGKCLVGRIGDGPKYLERQKVEEQDTPVYNFSMIISDSCFYLDVNIWGNDLRYFDTSSAHHCNLECQKDSSCYFFTFSYAINRCYLKYGALGTKRLEGGYISGPRTCTRMIGKWLVFKAKSRHL